ncbi:MAG: NAD/NADP octopine/nopaline dehydrogenase family protein [Proteobacteria bacterium]|nr:NAD/NADP octopine/nopaline dehydrogenase family protein [Pseudomonadota bacterium]
MKVAVLGGGSGGAASAVELTLAGHDVCLWSRAAETLEPFRAAGGIAYDGVLGSGKVAARMTNDVTTAMEGADAAVVVLPTYAHGTVARALAAAGWSSNKPVILNPGHTGGALEFTTAYERTDATVPPVAAFSTLTYVARKYSPECVTISGRAKAVRMAALPGGEAAMTIGAALFPAAQPVGDVLAADLANVNMVLHPPGAILAAAWVEARDGDFTFYVDAMTPGVARVMRQLDDERRAVARAFGHDLPNLIAEMQHIGTVEANVTDTDDFAAAIAAGEANRRIKGPNSLDHRYYREDFGHGLLPFLELAAIAAVATPTAQSLFTLGAALSGNDYRVGGRTAEAMGIAGLNKEQLLQRVRHQ